MGQVRRRRLDTYVTDKDRDAIRAMAAVCGVTVSTFMSSAALGRHLKPTIDLDAVARLGQLIEQQRELMRMLEVTPDSLTKSTIMTQIRVAQKKITDAAKSIKV
jgi:uncharacterized protein (DUF1778 family)